MSTNPEQLTAPAWNLHRVLTCNGTGETHIHTGEDYRTIALADLFALEPTNVDKDRGAAIIPSLYHDYDGRNHAVQRAKGQFVALCADVDSGDHPKAAITKAMAEFARGCACLIYSSPHARPGDRRWRIIVPLDQPVPFDTWHDAQNAFFNFLALREIEADRALARCGQLVYLPNVPEIHGKTGTALRADGKPLYYQSAKTKLTNPGIDLGAGNIAAGIAAIRTRRAADEQERERIRAEMERRRANKPRGDGANLIEDFNAENSVATMLELCGYENSPVHAEDWRSPYQTSDSFATRVIGSKWVSLSASDAASGLGERCAAGCYGDAYDLFVHFKHGGDHKAAFRALHAERRDSNVIYPERFEQPPEWMAPLPDEMPDYPEYEGGDYGGDIDIPPLDAALIDGKPRLPFFWFNEAAPNLEANDFVEDLLTTGSMSVVYGPSNCGKTFFIVDLALHVAWGREWRGKAVDRGAVVYLSLEGAQGIRNRLAAFRAHHGLDENLPFIAMPQPVNLLNEDADVNAVIELTKHVASETGLHVAMVIIDTLSRAMAGGNENSPEDMTAIVGNCDRIRDATGAHVCIVHHSGKDEARGARGHSSLRAATDTEIEIKRDPELTFSSVRIAKQRDLEAADPFAFSLHRVALGTNRRGKDVASCVVVEAEQSVALARNPTKLSPKEMEAVNSLNKCLVAAGFEVEISSNGDVARAVTLHAWKRALEASNIIDRNNDHVARTQFARIKKALENKAFITIEGDKVWMAQQ